MQLPGVPSDLPTAAGGLTMASLTIATLFPRATVAAGDEANASALARRAAAHGFTARAVTINRPEDFVAADVYLLGGTGRAGTGDLVDRLRRVDLADRLLAGWAVVFAVDAGMAALATTWIDPSGRPREGLGVLRVSLEAATPVTESVITRPSPGAGLPAMVGWVSYDTRVVRESGVVPLARIDRGQGNSALDADGVLADRVIATRLHGPVLAVNPELADLIVARVFDRADPLPAPLPETSLRARAARISEIQSTAPSSRSRLRRWR